MRTSADRSRRFPAGPELVSLAVLVLAALLVATALSYSWIATRGHAVDAAPPSLDAPCATPRTGTASLPAERGRGTMASCDGDRRISPGHEASMK